MPWCVFCGQVMNYFTNCQGYFTGTGPSYDGQWGNPEGYGWITKYIINKKIFGRCVPSTTMNFFGGWGWGWWGYNWDCNGNKIGKMQQELKQNPLSQQFPGKLLSKSMCYSVFIFPFIAQSMVIIIGMVSIHYTFSYKPFKIWLLSVLMTATGGLSPFLQYKVWLPCWKPNKGGTMHACGEIEGGGRKRIKG